MLTVLTAAMVGLGLAAVPAVASTGVVAAVTAPTPAATAAGDRLPQVQARGEAAIDRRLVSLTAASAKVTAAKGLTDAHRRTLLAAMAADTTGLTALRATIAADTTVAAAKAHDRSIFTDYRVYAVVLAQAGVVRGSDRLTSDALPKLQKAHDALVAAGKDATKLATMQQDIDAATSGITGVADAAIAVTPAAYDANHAVLTPMRTSLTQAVAQARAAAAIAKALAGGGA
jgi:hypothetical protein